MLSQEDVYRRLRREHIVPDPAQRQAVTALVALLARPARRAGLSLPSLSLLPSLLRSRSDPAPCGVYCHGPAGRGKSMVVDHVFALSTLPKLRVHFHEFLRDMNRKFARQQAGGRDALLTICRQWLRDIELLCFDEFHVHDLADAFLIGRFLETAVQLKVKIVLTSNYAPDQLLSDARYHERFAPIIDLIKQRFTLIHFNGDIDYRLQGARALQPRFLWPLSEATERRLQQLFDGYGDEAVERAAEVALSGRPLRARAVGRHLLWVDFDDLCVARRSHLDYLELCERWRGLFVSGLRVERLRAPDTLQRFVWLIDILYDHHCALFLSSDAELAVSLPDAATAGSVHDLARTVSRLAEMQSRNYASPFDVNSSTEGQSANRSY